MGFRIEPGEVESVLVRRPGVGRSVVVVREDRPGDRRLVAYVVLRVWCRWVLMSCGVLWLGCLPDYMVPAAFVVLDRFPLTGEWEVGSWWFACA